MVYSDGPRGRQPHISMLVFGIRSQTRQNSAISAGVPNETRT